MSGTAVEGSAARPRCLHVSGDFPDPLSPAKTPVFHRLIDLTADRFDHRVFSINRRFDALGAARALVAGGSGIAGAPTPFAHGLAFSYPAPARGLFHAAMLDRLGDSLAERASEERPDLVVAHKLTIEGIVAQRIAERLKVPLAVIMQGNTDCRILGVRPDLAKRFGRIFHAAQTVWAMAPWTVDAVERRLGRRQRGVALLPCPTDLDASLGVRAGDGTLVSAFHLGNWRGKNLAGMGAACRVLAASSPTIALDVIGGGDEAAMGACRAIAARAQGMHLAGPLGRAALQERLAQGTGFVLPSLRESFGLVFVEALFAGLPIVYPAGAAVDGYFDEAAFALRVDPRDPRAIAGAMARLVHEEATLKDALAAWQASPQARRFTRPAIAESFVGGLSAAIA